MIKQIGLLLRGRPILLITRLITDRIGLHSVLLPLLIDIGVIAKDNSNNNSSFLAFRIIISKETLSWIIFQEIWRHYDLFFLTDIKIQISF